MLLCTISSISSGALHAASALQPDTRELVLQAAVAASRPSTGKMSPEKAEAGSIFSSRLLGKGYHRTVEYSWTYELAADLRPAEQSSIGIVQPLPAGLFADMHQIGDIAKMSSSNADAVSWTATLLGSSDVERTIMESKPAVLVVQANSSRANSVSDQRAVLCIPLHARYALPMQAPPGLAGWKWAPSALATTAMPSATLLLSSRGDGRWRDVVDRTDVIWWDVPAASTQHDTRIGIATSAAVVLSCAVVLMEARRLRLGC